MNIKEKANLWFEETLKKGNAYIKNEQSKRGFFTVDIIKNVPLIHFSNFSEEENKEHQEQLKNVLRCSKWENNYNEVAITYVKGQSNKSSKCCRVYGDEDSVLFIGDENTRNLLKSADKENLVVVNLHNHPNDSGFSLDDIYIFANVPKLQLMSVVNREGKVTFLYNPDMLELGKILQEFLDETNINDRINKAKSDGIKYSLKTLYSPQEQKEILTNFITTITVLGVYYSDYTSDEDLEMFKEIDYETKA